MLTALCTRRTSHGRRSIDILKILCPEKATWECKSKKIALKIGPWGAAPFID